MKQRSFIDLEELWYYEWIRNVSRRSDLKLHEFEGKWQLIPSRKFSPSQIIFKTYVDWTQILPAFMKTKECQSALLHKLFQTFPNISKTFPVRRYVLENFKEKSKWMSFKSHRMVDSYSSSFWMCLYVFLTVCVVAMYLNMSRFMMREVRLAKFDRINTKLNNREVFWSLSLAELQKRVTFSTPHLTIHPKQPTINQISSTFRLSVDIVALINAVILIHSILRKYFFSKSFFYTPQL